MTRLWVVSLSDFVVPAPVEVVGLEAYDTRFADFVLPMALREAPRAKQLLALLKSEGPLSRVEYLQSFMRLQGREVDLSHAGLLVLDDWLMRAPILVTQPDPANYRSTLMDPRWAAVTVDVLIYLGELIRLDHAEGAWRLAPAARHSHGRLLPILTTPGDQSDPAYRVSAEVYRELAWCYGQLRSGLDDVPVGRSPINTQVAWYFSRLNRNRAEAARAAGSPARVIPPVPASTRAMYERAVHSGHVGEMGEFLVFAPMSVEEARAYVDAEEFPVSDAPVPELERFVHDLYLVWPYINDPEETMPSPWESDLYNQVHEVCIEVAPTRDSATDVLTTVLNIAHKYGMPVYATTDGEFI